MVVVIKLLFDLDWSCHHQYISLPSISIVRIVVTYCNYSFAMAIEVPNSIGADHQNGNGHTHAVVSESSKVSSSSTIISHPTINTQMLSILGLFVFYIGHDALQEEIISMASS